MDYPQTLPPVADDVTFVIPVWNRADLLDGLLTSVRGLRGRVDRVLAVDNGSSDNAVEIARCHGAEVIELGVNRGFAFAVNRGIEASTTTWIALLNTDVELDRDWLEHLLEAANDGGYWFACGKCYAPGRVKLDGTWDLLSKSGWAWRAGAGRADIPAFNERRAIAFSSATATLYRRELFARTGLFEERFESYLEDVDLSLRCAAQGLRGVYEPRAIATHLGSASGGGRWSERTVFLLARNHAMLLDRLAPDLRREWRTNIAVGRILWAMLAARHGRLGATIRAWRARTQSDSLDRLPSTPLRETVAESERELLALQRQTGFDFFWRLYASLTGGEAD